MRITNAPLKPIIMEWDEWQLSFQNDPVVIDYGGQVPDEETTTSDLASSGVRLHLASQDLAAQAEHREQGEQRRIP
ncbi:hypothetical protein [Pendulispora albinea]|uniref:Uncharacterized protein n=1 Tax=Pendulispora albinea TaxID=2741071 RepID=A0ABZ2LPB4_9BACT